MATYAELYNLRQDADLRNRVTVAVELTALGILQNPDATLKQVAWATTRISEGPGRAIETTQSGLVYSAKDLTAEQITGMSDAQLQAAVNQLVFAFIERRSN